MSSTKVQKIQSFFARSFREKSTEPLRRGVHLAIWALLRHSSLRLALKEQGMEPLLKRLEKIVPDFSDQYTYSNINISDPFWMLKVRGQHAFQISMAQRGIEKIKNSGKKDSMTLVDIGDSSGTHIRYLKEIYKDQNIRSLSVNLDPVAVNKIQKKGLEAVHARAEELDKYHIHPDIFISFQTLEHINSPIAFLKSIADRTTCDYFVITVPYRAVSRVGLFHIREKREEKVPAERTHIFELTPGDWELLCMHAGWRVEERVLYRQYPQRNPFRLLKKTWACCDHEGFLGLVLKRDSTWSDRYLDW